MTNHRITIILKDNAAIPAANTTLHIGDTVVYDTDPPNLRFRVVFGKSPFAKGKQTIRDSNPRTVTQRGKFTSKCFIKPPNGKEVGWRPDAPESGGEHEVKP